MRQWRRLLLVAFALGYAAAARADRGEFYTALGYVPGACRFRLPVSGTALETTAFSNGLELAVYYGLTNTWHVGARLRAGWSRDVHFSGATIPLENGSQSQGEVYLDHSTVGLGGLLHYRVDTRAALAPVLELEAGVVANRYSRVVHIPEGVTYTLPLSGGSDAQGYASAAFLLEYRFANRWVAAAGVAGELEAGGFRRKEFRVPLRLGAIW